MTSVTVVPTLYLFLFSLTAVCSACPRFTHPLSCGKCVAITTTPQAQSAARAACANGYNGGELLTVVTADELRVVRQYTAQLGGNDAFWVGYQYNGNTLTSGIDNTTASSLISNEVTAGSGNDNCLVILKNGSFEGRSCSVMTSQSLCLFNFTSPSPMISVTPANIMAGATVTVTCTFRSSVMPDTILFLRGGDPVSFGSVANSSTSATLTITSFSTRMEGGYECRTSVTGETAVSRVVTVSVVSPIPVVSSITAQLNSTSLPTNPIEVQFGTPLTLNCAFTGSSSSKIEWFINGFVTTTGVTTESDGTASTLSLSSVSTPGVYQCRIRNSDGTSGVQSFVLCGNLAETVAPGPVNIFGIPKSKTSLSITFLPPGNTVDTLLTTTSIFYRTSRYTDYNDASSEGNLVIDSSATGRYEYTLNGLDAGTRYWVAARATNMMGQIGEEAPFLTILDTFGNAPSTSPTGLTLLTTPDSMTLLADWDTVETVRPVGPLAFYDVQFTSRLDGVVNTLRIVPEFSFSVVTGVTFGNFYWVRVRSAIQIEADPDRFEYSPFTEYVNVSGTVQPSNVPTAPPTFGLLEEQVIAISVVVPVVVIGVILAVIAVVVVLLYLKSSKVAQQTDSAAEMEQLQAKEQGKEDKKVPEEKEDKKVPEE